MSKQEMSITVTLEFIRQHGNWNKFCAWAQASRIPDPNTYWEGTEINLTLSEAVAFGLITSDKIAVVESAVFVKGLAPRD